MSRVITRSVRSLSLRFDPGPRAHLSWTSSFVGIHFGTFIGAESESLEAIIELQQAVEDAGVKRLEDPNEDEKGRMGVVDLGETYCVPSELSSLSLSLYRRA